MRESLEVAGIKYRRTKNVIKDAWRNRPTLKSIFSRQSSDVKQEPPQSLFRNFKEDEPLLTGKDPNSLPEIEKIATFTTRQALCALLFVTCFGSCEAKCASEYLDNHADGVLKDRSDEVCNPDRPLPSILFHPRAWQRERQFRLRCFEKNDQHEIDTLVRDTRVAENDALQETCRDDEALNQDRFARFYVHHDVNFWSSGSGKSTIRVASAEFAQSLGSLPWLGRRSVAEDVREYIGLASRNYGQYRLGYNDFATHTGSLDIGVINRRRAFLMTRRFGLEAEQQEILQSDEEIRYWELNRALRLARARRSQREVIQRVFHISPHCVVPVTADETIHGGAIACSDGTDGTSSVDGVVSDYDGLNYQDRMRIMAELRNMFRATEARALYCAANNCLSLLDTESTLAARQALNLYMSMLRRWQPERTAPLDRHDDDEIN